ncbi:DUF1850 domain-containing protein [Thermococcus sp.]
MKKFFLFLLLLLLVASMIFPVKTVGIKFDGKECYYPLSSTQTLDVDYTHSVSLTKVVDVYRITDQGIYAIQEKWQEFLAGQPTDVQYRSGDFYVKDMNMYLGRSWEYWFIPLNKATLKINGRTVFIQPPEEGILRINVGRTPLILMLIRRC